MTNNDVRPASHAEVLLLRQLRRLEAKKTADGFGAWRARLWDLSPRWQWHSYLLLLGRIPNLPYSRIDFGDDRNGVGRRMIERCLHGQYAGSFDRLLEFLLHRFGVGEYRDALKGLDAEVITHWEKTFDLGLAVSLEADFLGDAYCEIAGRGVRQATGYFPTPMSVAVMMVEMTLRDIDLLSTVHDPCVGSGRMLLAASNYSLFLSGIDINPTCVRMTLVNGFLFAPQIPMPPPAALKSGRTMTFDRNILNTLPRINHDERGVTPSGERTDPVPGSELRRRACGPRDPKLLSVDVSDR